MIRRWAMVAALSAAGAAVGAAAGAAAAPGEEIFWDGFDRGDLCAWSNPPVTVTHETELFDQTGANDDPSTAQPIGRCAVVEGTIGDPVDVTPDTDFYAVNIQGPVLLHVKLERIGANSDFEAAGAVLDTYDAYPPGFGLTHCDPIDTYPAVTERQIYLPENGFVFLDPKAAVHKEIPSDNQWYINVDDGRNFDPCHFNTPPALIGGVDQTYRLTLTIDPVVGPTAGPFAHEPVQFPGDGSVLIYRIDGAEVPSLDLAETFSDRTDPGLLDTKLYLVRRSGFALATVAGDDDFDIDNAGFDSRVENQPLTAHPHFVIVDDYGKYLNGPIDMELTLEFTAPP